MELQAIGHALNPIIVDMSPPLAGTVYDGSISKHDLDFSKDQYQVCESHSSPPSPPPTLPHSTLSPTFFSFSSSSSFSVGGGGLRATTERRGGACVAFSEHGDAILHLNVTNSD